MDKQALMKYRKECKTIKEIAEKMGAGYSTVRFYLKKYGMSGDKRGAQRTWTDDDLIEAVKASVTKTDVIKKLGLSPNASGNFQTIDRYISELNIDISHFGSWQKNRITYKYNLSEILVKDSPYKSRDSLKKRLLTAGLLKYNCSVCNISKWQNKKLVLQLDHIDGIPNNNEISNLRLLCPNCHSQTSTFCRQNKNVKQ